MVENFHGPHDLSWEGARWYPEPWVDYHLNHTGYINRPDITQQIKASFSYPATMFQPLINQLFETMGRDIGKKVFVRFIGLFEIIDNCGL